MSEISANARKPNREIGQLKRRADNTDATPPKRRNGTAVPATSAESSSAVAAAVQFAPDTGDEVVVETAVEEAVDGPVTSVVDSNEGDRTIIQKPFQDSNGHWRVGPQPRAAHSDRVTSWPMKWALLLVKETVQRNSRNADAKVPGVTEDELAENKNLLQESLKDRFV